MLLLNSLINGSYDWLRKELLGFMTNANIMTTSEDIIEWFVTEHLEGMKAIESTLAAKQQMCPKAKSKYCTNCKRTNHTSHKCWEEGGGNNANTPAWVKKGNTNKSKNKVNRDKVYMSKDDSGSEMAATALDPMKLRPANPQHLPLSACLEDGYMHVIHWTRTDKIKVFHSMEPEHYLWSHHRGDNHYVINRCTLLF